MATNDYSVLFFNVSNSLISIYLLKVSVLNPILFQILDHTKKKSPKYKYSHSVLSRCVGFILICLSVKYPGIYVSVNTLIYSN